MARDFDGNNDVVTIAADASIDSWGTFSLAAWIEPAGWSSGFPRIFDKAQANADGGYIFRLSQSSTCLILSAQRWQTTNGQWRSPTGSIALNTRYHVAVVYDHGSTANDPVFYINGAAVTVTELTTPAGSAASESEALTIGNNSALTNDWDGNIGWAALSNELFSADDVNRARWWGRPKGGLAIYHPMLTDKIANEGTATADGSNSGSVVTPFAVPVVRPGSAMMGCGVGY